jgi:hypothetical protein
MNSWDSLERELDLWQAQDRVATVWWRDDDAWGATPQLACLLALGQTYRVAIALAVIPARLEKSLLEALEDAGEVLVLQHGFSHLNHAPPNEKKCELGLHRPADVIIQELAAGWDRLRELLGDKVLPVLVPPWNRIAPDILQRLASVGFSGVSTFGPRASRGAGLGLRRCNAHVDIIDWHGSRGFVGLNSAVAQLVAHFAARRTARVDPAEPTGLMTHHWVHDAECWDFCNQWLAFASTHPAINWVSADELFLPD